MLSSAPCTKWPDPQGNCQNIQSESPSLQGPHLERASWPRGGPEPTASAPATQEAPTS
ncbi:hypothetical protein P7K49_031973 [Saguinus oedipus]|uniref:Uncharacterized protein n=1 Tax=Saguinus oedipus TaxID=9490 RepID=A0ABQ9U116_SAGOE|nr:hypothetical protein P7K49_031973 [Saguinus oedipus]